jgi:hypothetical protein
MNVAIEMHDSKCLAVEVDKSGNGFVLLKAYVHRSEGEPGAAPGDGGVQHIRIKVDSMRINGELGSLPADIFEGSLTIGASFQDNMVPFPASYSGDFSLSIMLADDARVVVISGTRLSIEPEGQFTFVEDFSGRSS